MRLLRRKKDDEEDEKGGSPEVPKKRRRRKKEEPPKPWGKKERVLVLGLLLSTVVGASVLALSARAWKLPGAPRIELPTDVFQETYEFEGKKPVRDTSKVISDFNDLTKEASGVYGLYVINLNTDESFGVNQDEVFQAASLIKLPVIAEMYSKAEDKEINLDQEYSLKNSDKVGGSGSIAGQPAGTVYTYRELLDYMGQQSDNTAFNVCRDLLGDSSIDQYTQSIGLTHTSLADNTTTPRDIGIYFKKLWSGKLVNKTNRDAILKSLTDTIYEDYIPVGVPDVRVAHKFGKEVNVTNDAGIVFGKSPYVIVVMSKGIVDAEGAQLIPEIAAMVDRFENQD